MKLTSAALLAGLIVLGAFCPRAAQASSIAVRVPDPGCTSLGTISTPVVTVGGAPGDCVDFTWGPSTPADFLAIVVTDVEPPLTCSIVAETGESFNQCDVLIPDVTVPVTPGEIALLDGIISLAPGLTSNQVSALDYAVSQLTEGDGLVLALCNPNAGTCSDLTEGETGGVSAPEPPSLLLLGVGMLFLSLCAWKYRKPRWVSQGGLPA